MITNKETGRKYIGRKQYFFIKQPRKRGCKSLVSDKSCPRFKPSCWKESDWREYTGSSKTLNKEIKKVGKDKFTFEIIKQCSSKSHLHYAEVEELVVRGALWKYLDDDTPEYYNRQIPGTKFRIKGYEITKTIQSDKRVTKGSVQDEEQREEEVQSADMGS